MPRDSAPDLSIVIDSGEVGDGVGPWALKYSCSPSYDGQIIRLPAVPHAGHGADPASSGLGRGCRGPIGFPARLLADWRSTSTTTTSSRARGKALHAHVMRYAGVSLSDLIAEKENLETDELQW